MSKKDARRAWKRRARKWVRSEFGFTPSKWQLSTAWYGYSGKIALCVTPTGSGKFLTVQIASRYLRKHKGLLTVVISPLISLMADQVKRLRESGLKADFLSHSLTSDQIEEILKRASRGKLHVLLVAPERLKSVGFRAWTETANIGLVVLDEAHCLDRWGQDFRPSYGEVGRWTSLLRSKPGFIAMTATAGPQVEESILRSIRVRGKYLRVVAPPTRPNLHYSTARSDEIKFVSGIIRMHARAPGCAIVYCATRKAVEAVARELKDKLPDYTVHDYHGARPFAHREMVHADFRDEKLPLVVVATNAFGMGVDRSNVRLVLHYDPPASLFEYVQESGRAGRDGDTAHCYLCLSRRGVNIRNWLTGCRNPPWWIYERLWSIFSHYPSNEPFRVLIEDLEASIFRRDPRRGWVEAALNLIEYKGSLKSVPGITTYFMDLKSEPLARSILKPSPLEWRIKPNMTMVVKVPPGQPDDAVLELVSRRAAVVSRELQEKLLCRVTNHLTVTPAFVQDKTDKAAAEFQALMSFAALDNDEAKHARIKRAFA